MVGGDQCATLADRARRDKGAWKREAGIERAGRGAMARADDEGRAFSRGSLLADCSCTRSRVGQPPPA